jgi:hypothetical protein
MYWLILFQFFPPYLKNAKKCDQQLICYVEIHTDDPQSFNLRMDLNMIEG